MNQIHTKAFLGHKLEHLLPLYEEGGFKIRFSFAAAFWNFFWFFYHRMVILGFAMIALFFWSNGALKTLLVPLGVPCLAVEGIHLVCMAIFSGFMGPWLHYVWSKWRVRMLVKRYGHLDKLKLMQVLLRKGGTDLKGTAWLFVLPLAVLLSLLMISYVQDPELVTQAFITSWHQSSACGS